MQRLQRQARLRRGAALEGSHPPGTSLNFHPDATAEVVDDHKVRLNFPEPDGLVLGKFRGMHVPSTRFWEEEGFGYRKNGTGEGHW